MKQDGNWTNNLPCVSRDIDMFCGFSNTVIVTAKVFLFIVFYFYNPREIF